jgi:hypothetical protein
LARPGLRNEQRPPHTGVDEPPRVIKSYVSQIPAKGNTAWADGCGRSAVCLMSVRRRDKRPPESMKKKFGFGEFDKAWN